jgi:photosystem II stability/assembly factor-like uncharacterized protein
MQRFGWMCFLVVLMSCAMAAQEQAATAKAGPVSQAVIDALDRPAVQSAIAAHSVLLDVTRAGSRVVAVGERGVIVYSDDSGRNWRQATVPTSVSLATVRFVSASSGWAVGHSGVVLHTEDGGLHWSRQLDGKTLAQLAVDAAQAELAKAGANNKDAARQLADAQLLVTDGPDKPFLSIYFENERTGFVVGAYGIIFHTEDAGKSWTPWMSHVDNPRGLHLYSIVSDGKNLYMAGEQGLFLRSTDGGNKFVRVETPYRGTYFTMLALNSGEVILCGMRGNAYRSTDQGKSFKQIAVPIPVSFSAAAQLADGTLLFANQAGQLLTSPDKGATIIPVPETGLPPTSGFAEAGNGMLITVGFAGAIPVPMSLPGAAPNAGGTK